MNFLATTWTDRLSDYASALTTALGVAAPLVGLFFGVRARYRRTLGRRRDHYQRLARLGVGAQLSFFVAILGVPPAIRRSREGQVTERVVPGDPDFDPGKVATDAVDISHEVVRPRRYTECFFIDRDYYVQTVSDEDETVLAFSVTTRDARFAPRFTGHREPSRFAKMRMRVRGRWELRRLRQGNDGEAEETDGGETTPEERAMLRREAEEERRAQLDALRAGYQPLFRAQLGHTRFAEIRRDYAPRRAKGGYWARGFSYSEIYWFGNPGFYLYYVFTASSAACPASVGAFDFTPPTGWFNWPPEEQPDDDMEDWSSRAELQRFRQETVVTTYTVIGSMMLEDYPTTFGPTGDEVRTLP